MTLMARAPQGAATPAIPWAPQAPFLPTSVAASTRLPLKLLRKIPQHSLWLLPTERSVLRLLRQSLSSWQEQFGALVKAVANKADVKIRGDGPKDDKAKWKEDRERVVDEVKDSTSDIHLLLSAAASSQADKARRILEKYAPRQQTKNNRVYSISNLIRDF